MWYYHLVDPNPICCLGLDFTSNHLPRFPGSLLCHRNCIHDRYVAWDDQHFLLFCDGWDVFYRIPQELYS